ncbi:acyltransferase domain-containing protein [Amycolatopsis sp. NPDC005003]
MAGSDEPSYYLLPLGAATADELEKRTAAVLAWPEDTDLRAAADALWARAGGPDRFRRAVLTTSVAHAKQVLARQDARWVRNSPGECQPSTVGFCCSGLGAPIVVAGRALYRTNTGFRTRLDRLDRLARRLSGRPLRLDVVTTPTVAAPGNPLRAARLEPEPPMLSTLDDQPLRWAIGYALARTWIAAGLSPDLVVGHSLGEYVAACLAGVFTEEDALRLVIRRAELVSRLPAGGMLTVSLPHNEVRRYLPDGAVIAAINAPRLTVAAGDPLTLKRLSEDLRSANVAHRLLPVDRPFHSPLLASVAPVIAGEVAAVRRDPPVMPWVSTVTGRWMRPHEATDPGYWARQLCSPVRFLDAVRVARRTAPAVLLEIGLGRELSTFMSQTLLEPGEHRPRVLASLPHSPSWHCNTASWLDAVSQLWTYGVEVDWTVLRAMTADNAIGEIPS